MASIFFEKSGIKEALETFRSIPMSSEDKMSITKAARLGLSQIKRKIQVGHYWTDRTGKLTKSHYTRILGVYQLEIGASARHAKWLAFGTKDHGPKKAKALSWIGSGGNRIFAGRVRGIKGRTWLRPAVIDNMNLITTQINKEVRKQFRGK